jgi:ferredoxin/flavodoxin---NADP+ reductase
MNSYDIISPMPTSADITIIGGGPVGLFAAFYAGLRQMSVCLVDSLSQLGGQLTALYPEKNIYDVPGFTQVLAKDLAYNLIEQAEQYHPEVALGQHITALEYDETAKLYTLRSTEGAFVSQTLLISTGIGAFSPKTLPLSNAPSYLNKGLLYTLLHLDPLRGKRVLIVGGGDSAFDWANTLVPITHSLTLIHRSDKFRAHEDSVKKLKDSPASIRTFHELRAIAGKDKIESAIIYDNRSKEQFELEVDFVLVNIGFDTSPGPLKEFGLEMKGSKIIVDSKMRTNRPGVFGAGDVATYEGKLPLIVTGFSEATIAVNFAKNFIDPKANAFPGHSSNMK